MPPATSPARDARERVVQEFQRRYGEMPALLARAPGRVNLIGDHTDYNDGFVLPMAIDRAVWIASRPRRDRHVTVRSLDFDEVADFDIGGGAARDGRWAEYVRGVAWALGASGARLRGWDGIVAGDVPVGAGLSSSAALELAAARTFAAAAALAWHPTAMALIAQRAENEWVGVNCGIMDQLISAAGERGHALLIDCRSLETRPVPLPARAAVVVLDTGTRRGLVDSAYNERRAQCQAAAAFFGVRALRDVDLATFTARAAHLDPVTRKRARHVVTENARTVGAAEALASDDLPEVGRLMRLSHESLRDDFEVSRHELDVIVALAQSRDGCYGARMTGAGFGGCAVALVDRDVAEGFAREIAQTYAAAAGLRPAVYLCAPSPGADLESHMAQGAPPD